MTALRVCASAHEPRLADPRVRAPRTRIAAYRHTDRAATARPRARAPARPRARAPARAQPRPRSRRAAPSTSRQGTKATRPAIRVRPGGQCQGWPRASTRPRWPVDAKTPPKNRCTGICPNRQPAPAARWACTWRDDEPGRRGHRGGPQEVPGAAQWPTRTNFERTPSEGRPSRPTSGARSASSQVRAHRDAARAAGPREATTQQGSKAARQQGSKAARQQGSKAARQQGSDRRQPTGARTSAQTKHPTPSTPKKPKGLDATTQAAVS
jgi:hypothetical protein